MDDAHLGAAFRAVRVRRGWRQSDVAARAGGSRATVSMIERGQFDGMSLRSIRAVATVLDIRIDVIARWRGADLHRLINARHSALHEAVAEFFGSLAGWRIAPEVSFSVYGERGVIDILAFHEPTGSLLVIELKTDIVDANELVGTVDRKHRLAFRIAAERGWQARTVSRWVIVTKDKTNQRRIEQHRAMLRSAFPHDGHAVRAWLRQPVGTVAALSMWTTADSSKPSPSRSHRVRIRTS